MILFSNNFSIINNSNLDNFSYLIDDNTNNIILNSNIRINNRCLYLIYLPFIGNKYKLKIILFPNKLDSVYQIDDHINNQRKLYFFNDISNDLTNNFVKVEYDYLYDIYDKANIYVEDLKNNIYKYKIKYIDRDILLFDIDDNKFKDYIFRSKIFNHYVLTNKIEYILFYFKRYDKKFINDLIDISDDTISITNLYSKINESINTIVKNINTSNQDLFIVNNIPIRIIDITSNYDNLDNFVYSNYSISGNNLILPYNFSDSSFNIENLYNYKYIFLTLYNTTNNNFRLVKCKISQSGIYLYDNVNLNNYNIIVYPRLFGYLKPIIYNDIYKDIEIDSYKILLFYRVYMDLIY